MLQALPVMGPAVPARSTIPDAQHPFDIVDRTVHAAMAPATAGLSPAAIAIAGFDWAAHLAMSPGKQIELAANAVTGAIEAAQFAFRAVTEVIVDPNAGAPTPDVRFRDTAWHTFPFDVYAHTFLSIERWWNGAATDIRGVDKRHEAVTAFGIRQLLDTVAPPNFLWSNPEALARTQSEDGMNLIRGFGLWLEDIARARIGAPPAGSDIFKVGETIAATPGKVIHRTRLAEIIQYAPTTEQVRPEPIVIVPAWIMKYYILDLSPANSLVRFLTAQGFTVFMISWKNPDADDYEIGFDDYRTLGVMPAIDAAVTITGSPKVHAVGYCIGGTLLAVVAAAMARDGDDRLASLSLFAAQTDFTEAGELMMFISESQVAFLEDMMWVRGYLDSAQMAGVFQLLRSNDLIWSRVVHEYLMGERSSPMDMMVWNADATRMPYRMHSEYLRLLFLDNGLAEGRFAVGGRAVALHDIRVPAFVVATEKDHVAPWRSVFKFHLLSDTEVTFVLTNGGHNAGILSQPGHPRRHFRMTTWSREAPYIDPDTWMQKNSEQEGSWWPAWTKWLASHSGEPTAVPTMGRQGTDFVPIGDAPGDYVKMK